jgi:diacylglycerol kinase (ATP)
MREGRRPKGLTRLRLATFNSLRGLRHCYGSEAAFRQEVWLAALLVLVVEILDTGIEVEVDRIGTEHSHLSGFAKDLGSTAVLFG